MISRIWHGKTHIDHGEAYFQILLKTGAKDYAEATGIRSVQILRLDQGLEAHFWMITKWEAIQAIAQFVGTEFETAQYYPVDDHYLLEKEATVIHCKYFPIYGQLQYFVDLLQGFYEGNNWVAVGAAKQLENIDFHSAIAQKVADKHSIYQILEHMLSWRLLLLKRLQGDNEFDIEQNSPEDWNINSDLNPTDWETLKSAFHQNQKDLLEELAKHDDRLLEKNVPTRHYDFRYLINGLIQHDFYHFGQISLLK
jgi:uncharacterized damage-inducible protein DinB